MNLPSPYYVHPCGCANFTLQDSPTSYLMDTPVKFRHNLLQWRQAFPSKIFRVQLVMVENVEIAVFLGEDFAGLIKDPTVKNNCLSSLHVLKQKNLAAVARAKVDPNGKMRLRSWGLLGAPWGSSKSGVSVPAPAPAQGGFVFTEDPGSQLFKSSNFSTDSVVVKMTHGEYTLTGAQWEAVTQSMPQWTTVKPFSPSPPS